MIAAPFAGRGTASTHSERAYVGFMLDELVPDNRMTRRIAEFAAVRTCKRKNSKTLERDIARIVRRNGAESRQAVRRLLSDRIRADFVGNRTQSVDGWRLAETEIELIRLATDYRSV